MAQYHAQKEPAMPATADQSTLDGDTTSHKTSTPTRFPTFHALCDGGGRLWRKSRRGLLILVLIVAVAHASLNIYASILLNRELAQIRQKGEPLMLAELAPPDVPEAQNAAPIYKQASRALQLTRREEALITNSLKPGSMVGHAEIAVLQKSRKAIGLARQAAARPGCRFPVDWSASPDQITLPHYSEARRLAQLLALQALQSARIGNTNEALSDVRAIFRMSDHLKNEPVLIGFLVARFVYSVAINTLADVLQTSPIPEAQARSFLASLPTADWSATYRHKLLAERTFTIWAFNSASSNWLQQYTGNENIAAVPTWLSKPLALLWAPLLKLDEVYALRLWKRTIAAVTPMQVPSPPDANELIEQQLRDAPRYALVTRAMFPVYASARQLRDSIEVWQRQMEIALALSSYHSLHGRYPARLQEAEAVWGKALAPDPYSNKPFQYRSDGRNFTLYSVGINRIDDGGGTSPARYSDNSPNPGDDIVWNPKH